jgi:hypothetical protein
MTKGMVGTSKAEWRSAKAHTDESNRACEVRSQASYDAQGLEGFGSRPFPTDSRPFERGNLFRLGLVAHERKETPGRAQRMPGRGLLSHNFLDDCCLRRGVRVLTPVSDVHCLSRWCLEPHRGHCSTPQEPGSAGKSKVNRAPSPGALSTLRSPFIARASRREM